MTQQTLTQQEMIDQISELQNHIPQNRQQGLYTVSYFATKDDLNKLPETYLKLLKEEFHRIYGMEF